MITLAVLLLLGVAVSRRPRWAPVGEVTRHRSDHVLKR